MFGSYMHCLTITLVISLVRVPPSGAFMTTIIPRVLSDSCSTRSLVLLMFTGIVEEMGTVVSLEERDDMPLWDGTKGKGTELTVEADVALEDAYLGCSICVNGVCLTATELKDNKFKVGLAPETLRRTYLGTLKKGDHVNLERASEIGGRNSGHFVQGHVDGMCCYKYFPWFLVKNQRLC